MGRKPKIQEGDILKVSKPSGPTPFEDRKKAAAEIVVFLNKQGIPHEQKTRSSGGVFWEEITLEHGFIRVYASTASIRIFDAERGWWGPYGLRSTLEELRQRHVG